MTNYDDQTCRTDVSPASRRLKEGVLKGRILCRKIFAWMLLAVMGFLFLYITVLGQDRQLLLLSALVLLVILCFIYQNSFWETPLPDSALEAIHDNAAIPKEVKLELAEHLGKHGTVTLQELERIERKYPPFTVQGVGAQKLMSLREKGV